MHNPSEQIDKLNMILWPLDMGHRRNITLKRQVINYVTSELFSCTVGRLLKGLDMVGRSLKLI